MMKTLVDCCVCCTCTCNCLKRSLQIERSSTLVIVKATLVKEFNLTKKKKRKKKKCQKALKRARFPLLLILSDKNRREYQQLSIFARLISIGTGVKIK